MLRPAAASYQREKHHSHPFRVPQRTLPTQRWFVVCPRLNGKQYGIRRVTRTALGVQRQKVPLRAPVAVRMDKTRAGATATLEIIGILLFSHAIFAYNCCFAERSTNGTQ